MSKLFTEQGFLSSCGEDEFNKYLDKEIDILLAIDVLLACAQNINEARIIGTLIAKRVGDKVADKIVAFKK